LKKKQQLNNCNKKKFTCLCITREWNELVKIIIDAVEHSQELEKLFIVFRHFNRKKKFIKKIFLILIIICKKKEVFLMKKVITHKIALKQ